MGSDNGLHRKQDLGHFLLNLLDSREVPGLEWISRDRELFKIPWHDKRNKNWANEVNIIFKKWEIYNNRYREGNAESWTEWKQTFRGALNKSPFVKAVPDMHQERNKIMPFRVYEFTDAVNKKRHRKPNIAGSVKVQTEPSLQNNPNKVVIPQVVLDELSNDNLSNGSSTNLEVYSENCSVFAPPWVVPQQLEGELMDMDEKDALVNNPNGFCGYTGYSAATSPFQPCLFGPQSSPERAVVPPPIPHPPPTHPNLMNGMADIAHVKFEAYYQHHRKVLEGKVGNSGVHLSSGISSKTMDRLKMGNIQPDLWEKIRGADYFKQVELPDSTQYQCNDLQGILNSFKRGVLLFYFERQLYVYRLCQTHVYASIGKEGNIMIDRRKKSEQLLFSMDVFEDQLKSFKLDRQNNDCPSPTITLTLGTKPGRDPLVHLELTILEAQNMLSREIPFGADIHVSGFDSVDPLLESFDQSMTLGSSSLQF